MVAKPKLVADSRWVGRRLHGAFGGHVPACVWSWGRSRMSVFLKIHQVTHLGVAVGKLYLTLKRKTLTLAAKRRQDSHMAVTIPRTILTMQGRADSDCSGVRVRAEITVPSRTSSLRVTS